LYSGAFARLAEITQVGSPERGYVFHNRLTHSLKVGQIARRLAEYFNRDQQAVVEKLGGLDPDTAEAAGLAHDVGHPPFGHIAEEELDELVREAGLKDGYEGNAQSFRIVTRLASSDARDLKQHSIAGLNLTRTTLDGILKYPWAARDPEYPSKWGFYKGEAEVFEWVREGKKPRQRSAVAEIMDWADDITFAIHDLLDFYCAGKIPIDRCKRQGSAERERLVVGMFKRKPAWAAKKTNYIDALESILELFPFDPEDRYSDSSDDRAKLFAFSTGLIRYFVNSCHLTLEDASPSFLSIEPSAKSAAEVLKQFIWEYIIENPELAVPQNGQRVAVRCVFDRLLKASGEEKYYLFPTAFSGAIGRAKNRNEQVRIVADCVAGMTEKEIMHFHRSLQGLG
jgi:dGTPase